MAKILVVEDETSVRRMVQNYLANRGFAVVEARNGLEALEVTRAAQPDVILLDIMMPKLDGISTCEKLKGDEATRHIPILFLTARRAPTDVVRGLEAGGDDYLTKPFNLDELLARIQAHLRVKASRDSLEQERDDLETLLEIARSFGSTLRSQEVFQVLVERMAMLVKVERCSLLLLAEDGLTARVMVASDVPDLGALTVDLDRYPEIQTAIKRKEPIAIAEVERDPLLQEVRQVVRDRSVSALLVVPIFLQETAIGALIARGTTPRLPFTDREIRLCQLAAELAASALRNARQFEDVELENLALEKLTLVDELTDTYNRRFLFRRLEEEIRRAQRYGRPLACCLLDIDHFKSINDTCGHETGDRVLKELAWIVLGQIRKTDVLARYGGEEFVLLLPETDLDGALLEAERIRKRVRAQSFTGVGPERIVTVSIGVAGLPSLPIQRPTDLLSAADDALYKAKRDGRDRVVAFSGPPPDKGET